MKRIYAVIELDEGSSFDPASDTDLDALAEDLLVITDKVRSATVYPSVADLMLDEGSAVS